MYNKIISAGLYMDIIDLDESSYRGIYRRASFSIQKFIFHTYKYTSFPYLHIQNILPPNICSIFNIAVQMLQIRNDLSIAVHLKISGEHFACQNLKM